MPSSDQNSDATGLLLVGHGTRSEVGTSQFLTLARAIAHDAAPLVVEPAFLEIQQPDIDVAVDRLLQRGIRRLVTLPLLLFAAGHAKRDIPDQVAAALARHSDRKITTSQAAHFGCHPALVELSRRRMEQCLDSSFNPQPKAQASGGLENGFAVAVDSGLNDAALDTRSIASGESCLLLVGRGSLDDSATAEMYEFARLRQRASGGIATEVAFLAMAQPRLEAKLAELARSAFRRIIVQPHLLFAGDLLESINRQVLLIQTQQPEKEWKIAPALADQPGFVTWATDLLRKEILDRCNEAVIRVVAGGEAD